MSSPDVVFFGGEVTIFDLPLDVVIYHMKSVLSMACLVRFVCTCRSTLHLMEKLHIIDANRYFLPKNYILTRELYQLIYALEKDTKNHKPLPLESVFCDAQDYNEQYGLQNLCLSQTCCYCTKNTPKNVNVLIKLRPPENTASSDPSDPSDLVMFITQFDIREPTSGYTCPLDLSIVYVQHEKPDISLTQSHFSITQTIYDATYAHKTNFELQSNIEPVLFCSCLERRQQFESSPEGRALSQQEEEETDGLEFMNEEVNKPLVVPRLWTPIDVKPPSVCGKWILFKMISASGDESNIDVAYFGARGFIVDLKKVEHVKYPDIILNDGPVKTCLVM